PRSGSGRSRGGRATRRSRACSRRSPGEAPDELPVPRERLLRHVREDPLERRRHRVDRRRARDPLPRRVRRRHAPPGRAAHDRRAARVLRDVRRRVPARLLRPLRLGCARAVGEGVHEVGDPLRVPRGGGRLALAARPRVLLADARLVQRRPGRERRLRRAAAARRAPRRQPGRVDHLAADGRLEPDQHLRRDQRCERLPAERAHGRPEPSRDHADRAAARPDAALPAARARAPAARLADGDDRLPADRRGGDAVAQRRARARGGRARARDPVPPLSLPARAARADRGRAGGARRRRADAAPLLLGRPALTAPDERRLRERALPGLQLRAAGAALGPAVRARAEHVLRLLRVRHRQDELGAALVLRRAAGRDRARRHCALRGLHLLGVLPPARGTRARAGAGRGAGSARGACAAARLGLHRRARRDARRQRLLPDDAVLLLLRVRRARARDPRRLRADGVKVVVLTTSYPSPEHPVAGSFVASAVRAARDAGIDVTVVSPAEVRHFGVAYGGGIAQNLRAAPWKLALVPGFLAAYALAARRAAAGADLVHAHWIPTALAARATGKPYVLQVWGTDVELARRAPALARPLLRGARLVVAASQFLAGAARELGAREVAVVPAPVPIPAAVGPPDEPPHVLYAGRLSEEKGILEFLEATAGLPRVVVGDGPLRGR